MTPAVPSETPRDPGSEDAHRKIGTGSTLLFALMPKRVVGNQLVGMVAADIRPKAYLPPHAQPVEGSRDERAMLAPASNHLGA